MKYAEAARRLRLLGCEEVARQGGGSHRKWRCPATGRRTTLPDWRAKDLKTGTIRSAIRKLGLEWDDFMGVG